MSNLNDAQFGDYQMSHRPARPGVDSGAPFHRAEEVMPDVTGPRGPQYYDAHERGVSSESFRQMRAAKDNPDADVSIYRAVPKAEYGINPGDWVASSRNYAQMHADSQGDGNWAVVSTRAKANEIWGHGDDPNEWGYHPKQSD